SRGSVIGPVGGYLIACTASGSLRVPELVRAARLAYDCRPERRHAVLPCFDPLCRRPRERRRLPAAIEHLELRHRGGEGCRGGERTRRARSRIAAELPRGGGGRGLHPRR